MHLSCWNSGRRLDVLDSWKMLKAFAYTSSIPPAVHQTRRSHISWPKRSLVIWPYRTPEHFIDFWSGRSHGFTFGPHAKVIQAKSCQVRGGHTFQPSHRTVNICVLCSIPLFAEFLFAFCGFACGLLRKNTPGAVFVPRLYRHVAVRTAGASFIFSPRFQVPWSLRSQCFKISIDRNPKCTSTRQAVDVLTFALTYDFLCLSHHLGAVGTWTWTILQRRLKLSDSRLEDFWLKDLPWVRICVDFSPYDRAASQSRSRPAKGCDPKRSKAHHSEVRSHTTGKRIRSCWRNQLEATGTTRCWSCW